MAFRIILDGTEREIDILRRRPDLVVSIDGRQHVVQDPGGDGKGLHDLVIAGRAMRVTRVETPQGLVLRTGGRTFTAALLAEGEESGADAASEIRAPMPGAVISIAVAPGDTVKTGDPIITIESMKLETVLSAPRAGIIAEILAEVGGGFDKDQVLARLEEIEEDMADA